MSEIKKAIMISIKVPDEDFAAYNIVATISWHVKSYKKFGNKVFSAIQQFQRNDGPNIMEIPYYNKPNPVR